MKEGIQNLFQTRALILTAMTEIAIMDKPDETKVIRESLEEAVRQIDQAVSIIDGPLY